MKPTIETQPTPISPLLVIGAMVVCALIVWLVFPSQRSLLDRQVRDESWARSLETLREMPASERARNPRGFALLELQIQRRLIDRQDPTAVRALINQACHSAARFQFPPEFVTEINELLAFIPDANEAFAALRDHLQLIPRSSLAPIYEALAAKALAAGQPGEAARLYSGLWRVAPESTRATLRMVDLLRQSGQAAVAVEVLDEYASRHRQPLRQLSHELAWLHITVLRESNQPGRAFTALADLMAASPAADQDRLFPLLVETAQQSGQEQVLLPELRRRSQARPDDVFLRRQLEQLSMAAGDQTASIEALRRLLELEPNNGPNHLQLARLYEWNNRPGDAFSQYLIALRLREPAAIDRLLELNKGLFRYEDMATALLGAGELFNWEAHGNMLPRLMSTVGRFDEAMAGYERLAARRDTSWETHRDYLQMLLDLAQYDHALPAVRRALAYFPRELFFWRSLAETHYRMGNFEESLQVYQEVVDQQGPVDFVESYLTLAESLGRFGVAARHYERWLRGIPEPTVWQIQRLVYFQYVAGDLITVRDTLRRAVQKFPEEPALRRQLAHMLADTGEPAEAADVLRLHPDRSRDPDLVRFYYSLLVQSRRISEADRFVRQELDPALSRRLDLAADLAALTAPPEDLPAAAPTPIEEDFERLYRQDPANQSHGINYARQLISAKRYRDALAVLRNFVDKSDPEVLKLAAFTASDAHDYKAAAVIQRKLIELRPEESGRSWGYMGDILAARGDQLAARVAYMRAIQEMLRAVPTK